MVFVLWASRPFVVRAAADLPLAARRNKSTLERWRPTADTGIEFTTIRWFGLPRTRHRASFGDLRIVKRSLGIQNVIALPKVDKKSTAASGKPSLFYLGKNRKGYIGNISLLQELQGQKS